MATAKEPEATWRASGVFLLTDSSQGRVAIPDLELRFEGDGVELAKDDGELAWHCPWPEIDVLSTAGLAVLPDGREGVVVVIIEEGGRQHRFILPSTDPEEVQSEVHARAKAYRIQTFEPPAAVWRPLSAAVVVAALATLAVLLLSAAHVLHL